MRLAAAFGSAADTAPSHATQSGGKPPHSKALRRGVVDDHVRHNRHVAAPQTTPNSTHTEAVPIVARGRAEAVGGDAGAEAGEGHRQRDEAVVGGEDAAADAVGRFALQAVGRDLPGRAAAEVREEDGGEPDRQRRARAPSAV